MAMTPRENLLHLWRREGYEYAPVNFSWCPSQQEEFNRRMGKPTDPGEYFKMPMHWVPGPSPKKSKGEIDWRKIYPFEVKPDAGFDSYGVAHEKGSEAAKHMTHMRHPLEPFESVEQLAAWPMDDFSSAGHEHIIPHVKALHDRGLAAMGGMACTIWEVSWYLRGMEQLMMDMMNDDPCATWLLDKMTESAISRAQAYTRAGCDCLQFGDDVGTQSTLLMSPEMYREWIKPRFRKVIAAVREVSKDIIITYHSCGYVTPLIDDLIDVGVQVLNPVQPECMDFAEIHERFGNRLSFWGSIGTQTTMPFGTPADVRREVLRNLGIAGPKGGLFCSPTHLIEPEVPWENIMAYVDACREFTTAGA